MKTFIGIIVLSLGILFSQSVMAGESSSRITIAAQAAEFVPSKTWFATAMENALKVGAPRYSGTQIPQVQLIAKRNVLNAMVQAKKLQDAKPLIIKNAPELLPDLAFAMAKSENAKEALDLIKLGSDDDQKIKIEAEAFKGLLEGSKLASADLYLDSRTSDTHAALLYAQLAGAQASASDNDGYQKSLQKAATLGEDLKQPQRNQILHDLAAAQAAAGDYSASRKTQRMMEGNDYAKNEELVLSAQLRRGEVKPADAYALIQMKGAAPILNVILEVQIKSRDIDGIPKTLEILRDRKMAFQYSKNPGLIMDACCAAGKIKEAEAIIENFQDVSNNIALVSKARMYAQLALNQSLKSDKAAYQRLMNLAIEQAGQIKALGLASSVAMPSPSNIFNEIADIQIDVEDFPGAEKTVALIKDKWIKQRCSVRLQAAQYAATGRFAEAKTWIEKLDDSEDRCIAAITLGQKTAKKESAGK